MTAFWKVLAAGAAFTMVASSAFAAFPDKDIRMIVPWGAGGGTDGIVRKLSSIAEKEIGGTIYVENIEGGVSATGVSQLMGEKPDGYTIGALTYDSVVTVPWQGLLPSYSMDRLHLIARVTSEPDALIVSEGSGYDTLADVIQAAKDKPGKVKIGIQNIGSRLHLTALQFQKETGTDFKLIAYPGGAAGQKEAMLNGEVPIVATSLGDFSSLLDDGKAKGVVEFTDTQNPTYTTVPTAASEGLDLRMGSFILIAAPAGLPDDVAAKIEGAYKAAYESDAFQSWLAQVGVTPNWLGSDSVTDWATSTATAITGELDALVAQGVINK